MKKHFFKVFMLSLGLTGATSMFAASYMDTAAINLNLRNVTIEQAFKAIEEQSEFSFFYNEEEVSSDQRISIHVKDKGITEVLNQLLNRNDIAYKITDRHIVLYRKTDKAETNQSSQISQKHITVKGVVTDENGLPIIGVTIITASKNGTTTDIDGNYTLEATEGELITFSYIGYSEQSVEAKSQLNIQLKPTSIGLDEVTVVAIGYGVSRKSDLTGSIASVSAKDFKQGVISSAEQLLQGKVAGLVVSQGGGDPTKSSSMRLRGGTSLSASNAPLVVVDGIPGVDLSTVQPNEILSMDVLKDASAAAVYGARAAYGVVLVTTKSGKQEKARVTYRGSVGFSSPINMPQMMSSLEWARYSNLRDESMGRSHQISDATIQKMEGFMQNPYSAEFPGIDVNQSGDGWAAADNAQYANTDWFDYYFKDRAIRHSHNISIQGGSEKTSYYVGLGYIYQEGLMDKVQDDLEKYNVNTKFSIRATDWLKFNFNNNVSLSLLKRPLANQTIFYGTIANMSPSRVTKLPVEQAEYSTPTWNEQLYLQKAGYSQNRVSDAMSFSAIITPLEGLEFVGEMKARLDVENNSFELRKGNYALPNGSVMEVSGNKQGYHYPGMKWQNTQFGSLTRGSVFNYYLSPSVTGAYTRQWGDHFFKGMAGFQMELQENSSEYMYKDGMLSEDIYSFDNANGTPYAAEARSHWATMGMFARLNWNYRNIYFLEFSGRYDGSSRFAPDNRWGFFPSFSAGYDISRTPYFTKLNLPVSQLKVRVSYGRLGNQNGAGLYDYLGVMTLDPNNVNAWLLPGTGNKPAKGTISLTPKMISPYITWEKVDNANIGLDLMLFDDRLSVTFDAYQRTTKDMIGPAEAIPAVSGIVPDDRAKINNATLRNRGWELSVNWQDKLKCGFSYGIGFNLFDYKAVVTKYNNPEGIIYNNHTGLARNKGYYEGMDIGEIWGFVADDLFMTNREVDDYLQSKDLSFFKADNLWQAGDLKYIDVNRDGKVDPGKGTLDDHGDLRIIGNTTPKYSFGINLKAGYKGFQVSTLFQGVGKRDFPLAGSTYLFGGKNYFKEHLDYFSPQNPGAYLPRLADPKTDDYRVNAGYNTTRYMVNAAYMRMKNLTVSYTFDKKMLKALRLENLRLYFTCDNLFTITSLPKSFDPETLNQVNTWAGGSNDTAPGLTSAANENGNGKVYPMNRNFVFGIDFTF